MSIKTIYIVCIACGYDGKPAFKKNRKTGFYYTACPACNSSQVKERSNR